KTLNCNICEKGKKANKKFKKSNKLVNTKEKGETIHTDICGPITPTTYGGNRYFISFIDDFTRKSWIYIIKSKDQAIEKLKELYKLLKNQYNIRIKSIISDGGGEYTNESFKQFLNDKGITHCITPPYTPQRNGVAERFNRTILEKIRCMIKTSNIEKELWEIGR